MSTRTASAAVRGGPLPLDAYRTSGSSPTATTLHLVGAGRVGRALLRLLQPADGLLVAVSDSSGTAWNPLGLDPREIVAWKASDRPLAEHPSGSPGPAAEHVASIGARVVVDATATDFRRPAWGDALDGVVARGGRVALAAKDPAARLGFDWLAPGSGLRCGVNAALGGAGAGIQDDLAELRSGCVAVALAGSASTTAILSVIEGGGTLDDGITAARERGLLEADPEQDLRGLDSAVKLSLVARILWNADVPVEAVPCQDLRDVDLEEVRRRARAGKTTRLVARGLRTGAVQVRYEEVPLGSALATTPDRVAYAFELPGGRARFHLGAGLGPEETARALLADVQRLQGPPEAPARRSGRVDADLDTGVVHLPADFRLESGTALHPAQVAFESRGPDDGPVVLALGGISAHRHAADPGGDRGWWPEQVGPGRALDTLRHRVLSVDWLGGSGGSSGPLSSAHWDPEGRVTAGDQARAVLAVLDAMGVERVHLAVGASYGGAVVLELARRAPERVRAFCVLGAAHRPHAVATAYRSLQRRIVRLGQETGRDADALALARGLGMVSYRSARELGERFTPDAAAGVPARFPVEEYLEARGQDFARRFDPRAFLCLSESLDRYALRPAEIRVPGTFVAFEPDTLVPRELVDEAARELGAPARTVVVSTLYGHDGFLKEHDAVARALTEALETEVAR